MSGVNVTRKILVMGMADGHGGAQTSFRELATFLSKTSFEVAMVVIGNRPAISAELQKRILCQIPFSSTSKMEKLSKTVQVGKAALFARHFAPDVFVSVGLAHTASLVARALPRSAFKIAQDFIYDRSAEDPLLRSAARAFDAIGVQAPSMVKAFRRNGFTARPVNWIPCFPQEPSKGCIKQRRQGTKNIRLAYFGRIARHKGLHLFLEALAHSSFNVPVSLDLWGSGDEVPQLIEQSNQLGLSDSVSFCGPFPAGQGGGHLMCTYDAMVVPSIGSEGLPLILLEAMAYGLPFLTTNVGAIPDCCLDNPDVVLVEPQAKALQTGLARLIQLLTNHQIDADRLRTYYETHFSRNVMEKRWMDCICAPEGFFNEAS